jgi:hypothetical protein
MGLPSNAATEPLEPPGGGENQRRRGAGAALHRRHPPSQHVNARAVELVEGPVLRMATRLTLEREVALLSAVLDDAALERVALIGARPAVVLRSCSRPSSPSG